MRNRYLARSRPGSVAPVALECAAGDADRLVDVLDVGARDLGERLLRRRIDGGEPLPAAGATSLPPMNRP